MSVTLLTKQNSIKIMSAHNARRRTCPACQSRLSFKTKIKKHLFNHCSVTHELKQDIINGVLTKAQVANKINEYLRISRDCSSKLICACELMGTNFCRRIVSLIDWNSERTLFTVRKGNTKNCFVRYSIRSGPQIHILPFNLNFWGDDFLVYSIVSEWMLSSCRA